MAPPDFLSLIPFQANPPSLGFGSQALKSPVMAYFNTLPPPPGGGHLFSRVYLPGLASSALSVLPSSSDSAPCVFSAHTASSPSLQPAQQPGLSPTSRHESWLGHARVTLLSSAVTLWSLHYLTSQCLVTPIGSTMTHFRVPSSLPGHSSSVSLMERLKELMSSRWTPPPRSHSPSGGLLTRRTDPPFGMGVHLPFSALDWAAR